MIENFPSTAITIAIKYLSVSRKLEILKKAETTGNVPATARANNIKPNKIRNRRKNIQKLIAKKNKNYKAQTLHSGESTHHP